MLDTQQIIELAILSSATGFMAGCTGVGGVFLVPGLVWGMGIGVHDAIAAVMFAFIASGGVGLWTFARRKSIRWDMAAWLFATATPFAFVGAWTVDQISAKVLQVVLCFLTLSSGLYSLLRPVTLQSGRQITPWHLGPIGATTGFLSALTGTGGAVVLMPILLSMRVAPLTAIGLSTAVQFPIAITATLGNILIGNLDFRMGLIMLVTFAPGMRMGAVAAHVLPQEILRRLVTVTLLAVGAFIGFKTFLI